MKGIVFSDKKYGYLDLPKVACTTIKSAIYHQINGNRFQSSQEAVNVHRYFGKIRKEISGCERRFIVIRDPVKRFLSAYGNRVTYHAELSEGYIKNTHPDIYNEIPVFNPGLGQFIENLNVYLKVPAIYHHVRPMGDFLNGEDLSFFTDVFKIENIKDYSDVLSDVYQKDVKFDRLQAGGKKPHLKDLSRQQLQLLINFYRKDYELLKDFYSVDALWAEWNSVKNSSFPFKSSNKKLKTDKSKEAPFIIWTLRRTGGTNLAQALFDSSKFNGVNHEPYNKNRVFGFVQKNWEEYSDPVQLIKDVAYSLKDKPLIKHCVEICPTPINMAILRETIKLGYRHVFLYREESIDRLLSLNYARVTDIWGKEQAKELPQEVFEQPIPVENLLNHEQFCRESLTAIHKYLTFKKEAIVDVNFESLYVTDELSARDNLMSVVESLHLNKNYFSEDVISSILFSGAQGTKQHYMKFARMNDFLEKVKELPKFGFFDSNIPLKIDVIGHDLVDYFTTWNPQLLKGGEIILSGIFLTDTVDYKLFIKTDEGKKITVNSALRSDKQVDRYPEHRNSAHCRFQSNAFVLGNEASIYAEIDNTEFKIATIK